jgi:hypothetical protein
MRRGATADVWHGASGLKYKALEGAARLGERPTAKSVIGIES